MTDGRDDEMVFLPDGRDDDGMVFLTGCREHGSVPVSVPRPRSAGPVVFSVESAVRPRRASRRRKLYLADLAIIVVAMALGSVMMRYAAAPLLAGAGREARPGDFAACFTPLGIAAAGLLAVYRLRGPRDRIASVLREPGTSAGLMLALTACFFIFKYTYSGISYEIHIEHYCTASQNPADCRHPGWVAPDAHYLEESYFRDVAAGTGLAVAVAWAWLGMSGGWKPRRDWIDLAGLALGVCWIAASVACLADPPG